MAENTPPIAAKSTYDHEYGWQATRLPADSKQQGKGTFVSPKTRRKWWGAIAVAATVLPASVQASSAVATSPTHLTGTTTNTRTIDLATIETTVTDPLAEVKPIIRDCQVGQVDVNTAEASRIGKAIGVASGPTLSRIVTGRPWTDPRHLVSVPGIGPNLATTLNARLCASPTPLPPAAAQAPTRGFTGIDLQYGTPEQLATLMPRPVAERLAAIPVVPDNLHQLEAPAVPGLSAQLVDELLNDPHVAITPMPFSYQGKTWRWVTPEHGAVVNAATDSRYALIVPPGAMVDGGWATTTIEPSYHGLLPVGDYAIYGSWVPEVAVKLPQAAEGVSGSVIHDTPDGARFSNHDNVVLSGESVVAPALSLSPFTATTLSCGSPDLPYCTPMRDEALQPVKIPKYEKRVVPQPMPCPSGTERVLSDGSIPTLVWCETSADAKSATWSVKSPEKMELDWVFVKWSTTAPAYDYDLSGPAPTSVSVELRGGNDTYGVIEAPLVMWMAEKMRFLPAASDLKITKQMGDPRSEVTLQASMGATLLVLVARSAGGLVQEALDDIDSLWLGGKLLSLKECIGIKDANGFFECLKTGISNVLELRESQLMAQWEPLDGRTVEARALKKRAAKFATASRYFKALALAPLVADLAAETIMTAIDIWPKTMGMEYQNPPPPPSVGGDGLGGPSGGKYIARTSKGAAYLVDIASNKAGPIKTAGDFNCLAPGFFVVDNVSTFQEPDSSVHISVDGNPTIDGKIDTTCTGLTDVWTYTPLSAGGNVPNGIIIRQPDWQQNWAGYIDGDGVLHWLKTGESYNCMAKIAPAIFNFPATAMAQYPRGDDITTCTTG